MKNLLVKNMSKLVVMMLIAVMALTFTACSSSEDAVTEEVVTEEVVTEDETEDITADDSMDDVSDEITAIGEGSTVFTFTVTFEDATMHLYEVSTDATTVGDALVEVGLIEGEDSEYGLYVKTVDGVTLDWDTDAAYWAFYIDGEMAMSGVDTTDIVEGSTYTFAYAQ